MKRLKAKFKNKTEQKISEVASTFLNPTESSQKHLLNFAKQYSGLKDSILEEIVTWADTIKNNLNENNPFIDEENFIHKLEDYFPTKDFSNFENIKEHYSNLDSVKSIKPNIDFNFYKKSIEENANSLKQKDKNEKIKKSIQRKFEKQNEILSRNLLGDMQKELERRKTNWELYQIEIARKDFLKALYEKIEKVKKLFEMLKSFTKDFGRLWDLAQGEFEDCGFEILEKYADLLENDKGLQELAKMIGRHYEEEQRFHKELRSKIIVDTKYNPKPAYKGELSGLRLSGNITDALPSELALYANKKTAPIFKIKFAQKQLLSYAYIHNYEYQETHAETEEVEVAENLKEKGPMILCIDTSGSMHGTPERVAKTIAFALSQKSLEENRSCYLITFSTGIETMDLSTFNSSNGLNNLVKFLRMSFNGGTDANPALVHSIKMLEENEAWKNSDVLMISDFVMGELNPALVEKIQKQQEKKTRFFSLAITSSGNNNVISLFDKNWIYDENSTDASKKLVRQLYEMKKYTD